MDSPVPRTKLPIQNGPYSAPLVTSTFEARSSYGLLGPATTDALDAYVVEVK